MLIVVCFTSHLIFYIHVLYCPPASKRTYRRVHTRVCSRPSTHTQAAKHMRLQMQIYEKSYTFPNIYTQFLYEVGGIDIGVLRL